MNLFVHPSKGFNIPSVETEDSIARILVVPTAHTFFLFRFASFTMFAAFSGMITCSESILCFVRSSTSTERNVPNPTCNVNSAKFIPFNSKRFNNSREKCNPAVGAATAPSSLANMVWYISSSIGSTSRLIYFGRGVSPSSVIIFLNSS